VQVGLALTVNFPPLPTCNCVVRWCSSFVRDCGHDQDAGPFAAEEIAAEVARRRRTADGVAAEHEKWAVSSKAEHSRSLQSHASAGGIGPPPPGEAKPRRRRRKRNREQNSAAASSSHKKRARYDRTEMSKDYETLLAQDDDHFGADLDSGVGATSRNTVGPTAFQESLEESQEDVVIGRRRRAAPHQRVQDTQDSGSETSIGGVRGGPRSRGGGPPGDAMVLVEADTAVCAPPSWSQQTAMSSATETATLADHESQPLSQPYWSSPAAEVVAVQAARASPSVRIQQTASRATEPTQRTSTVPVPDRADLPHRVMHPVPNQIIPMPQLHREILTCCHRSGGGVATSAGGDSDSDDSFINDAPDAEADTAAARVNERYNRHIAGLPLLSVADKAALYLTTYQWMKSILHVKDDLLQRLSDLQTRLERLKDDTDTSIQALSVPQQREFSSIQGDFDQLEDEHDTYFKQLERAGFEVLSKLRHTGNPEVRLRAIEVSSWPVSVNDAKRKLSNGLRDLCNSLEDMQEMWGIGDSSDSSSHSSDGYATSSGSDAPPPAAATLQRSASTGSGGRIRDAAKEAGTLLRRGAQDEEVWDAELRRSLSLNSRGSGPGRQSVSRTSSTDAPPVQGVTTGASTGVARIPSSRVYIPGSSSGFSRTVNRNDRSTSQRDGRSDNVKTAPVPVTIPGAVVDLVSEDDSFLQQQAGDDAGLPLSDSNESYSNADAVMTTEEVALWWSERTTGKRRRSVNRRAISGGTGGGRGRAQYGTTGNAVSRSTTNTGGITTRVPTGSFGGLPKEPSTRLQREIAEIARGPRESRRSATRPSSKPHTRHGSDGRAGSADTRGEGGSRVPLYRRDAAPTVADLGPHVRYDGRITVLEGLLQNAHVPPAGEAVAAGHHGTVVSAVSAAVADTGRTVLSRNLNITTSLAVQRSAGLQDTARASITNAVQVAAVRAVPPALRLTDVATSDPLSDYGSGGLVDVLLDKLAYPDVGPVQRVNTPEVRHQPGMWGDAAHPAWADSVITQLMGSTHNAGLVRAVGTMTLAVVNEILHRLAVFRELDTLRSLSRSCVSHDDCRGSSSTAQQRKHRLDVQRQLQEIAVGFDRRKVWDELLSMSAQKAGRLKALLSRSAQQQCLPHAATGPDSRAKYLGGFLQRVFEPLLLAQYRSVTAYPQAEALSGPHCSVRSAADGGATNLAVIFLHAAEDKPADLMLHIVFDLLRHKVTMLTELALSTVEAAKARLPVSAGDATSLEARAQLERGDWELMNLCFTEVVALQREVLAALLWNRHLLLALMYQATLGRKSTDSDNEFTPGLQCRASSLGRLLCDTLQALRTMHTVINAARTSSNASGAGARVWAAYDASREQMRGPIALYHRNVWQGVAATIQAECAHVLFPTRGTGGSTDATAGTFTTVVNPTAWRLSGPPSDSESPATSICAEDIWGVLAVFTHYLRMGAAACATQPCVKAVRVESAWDLLLGVATAQIDVIKAQAAPKETAECSQADQLLRLLRRVARISAVWTEGSSEGPSVYFQLLARTVPCLQNVLPMPATLPAAQQPAQSHSFPPLDNRNLVLLCLHAHFGLTGSVTGSTSAAEARDSLHRHLLLPVSMLLNAVGLSNPYSAAVGGAGGGSLGQALASAAEGADQQQATRSLKALLVARQILKELLHSANTERYLEPSGANDAANVAAVRNMTTKVPRMFAKFTLLELLAASNEASYQAGCLLCLLVKEMAVFFGQDIVRNKLKLSLPSTLSNSTAHPAEPLQQTLMNVFAARIQGAGCHASLSADNQVLPVTASAAPTLAQEVEQLLRQAPRHGQENACETSSMATSSHVQAAGSEPQLRVECLGWFAAAITFHPFPVCSLSSPSNLQCPTGQMIVESDITRLLSDQKEDAQYLEPVVQMLRSVTERLRCATGTPVHHNTALQTGVAVSAVLLRHLRAVSESGCMVPLDVTDLSSEDFSVMRKDLPLLPLHIPLLREVAMVASASMAGVTTSKAKDSLPVSGAFLFASLVSCLFSWHEGAAQMARWVHIAGNLDVAAQQLISTTLAGEFQRLTELLSDLLVVPAMAAARGHSVPYRQPAPQLLVPELVSKCCTLLCALAATVKNQDVSTLNYSTVATSISTAQDFRQLQSRKLNTSAGCMLALSGALGQVVGVLVAVSCSPLRALASSNAAAAARAHHVMGAGTVAAILTEVTEALAKAEAAAAAGGANLLVGHWLRVAFWRPVLACLQDSATDVGIIVAHLPSVLGSWLCCALTCEASPALISTTQELGLAAYAKDLTCTATRVVDTMRSKCNGGTTWSSLCKLSSPEMQSLRLAELFTQASNAHASSGAGTRQPAARFLSLLAAGHTSTVLQTALASNGGARAGQVMRAFPVSHRADFEATNAAFVAEVLRCIQYLTLCVFRCGIDPSKAKQRIDISATLCTLKTLVAEVAYMYRGTAQPANSAALRNVPQLPRMIPFDLVDTVMSDVVMPDVITLVDGMFQRAVADNVRLHEALRGKVAAPAPSMFSAVLATSTAANADREANERALVETLPRYILMTSDTPYSTRMTAWRALLQPVFLASASCLAGGAVVDMSAPPPHASVDAEIRGSPLPLMEGTMDELPYMLLLTWALTLALPTPERLIVLEPDLLGAHSGALRDEFTRLVTQKLAVPIRVSTLWKVFKLLADLIRSSRPPGEVGVPCGPTCLQDPLLEKYKQYLLGRTGAGGNNFGVAATSDPTSRQGYAAAPESQLWNTLHAEARKALNQRVIVEQGKMAVQSNSLAVTSAATAMVVLPWSGVKSALQLHVDVFEEVLHVLIDARIGASAPTHVDSTRSIPLVVTSAVAMAHAVSALLQAGHQLRCGRSVSDTVKQRLMVRLQNADLSCSRALVAQRLNTAAQQTDVTSAWNSLLRAVLSLCGRESTPANTPVTELVVERATQLVRVLREHSGCKNAFQAPSATSAGLEPTTAGCTCTICAATATRGELHCGWDEGSVQCLQEEVGLLATCAANVGQVALAEILATFSQGALFPTVCSMLGAR
jgi:hypothetical protein